MFKRNTIIQENDLLKEYNLHSKYAFEIISDHWLKI